MQWKPGLGAVIADTGSAVVPTSLATFEVLDTSSSKCCQKPSVSPTTIRKNLNSPGFSRNKIARVSLSLSRLSLWEKVNTVSLGVFRFVNQGEPLKTRDVIDTVSVVPGSEFIIMPCT